MITTCSVRILIVLPINRYNPFDTRNYYKLIKEKDNLDICYIVNSLKGLFYKKPGYKNVFKKTGRIDNNQMSEGYDKNIFYYVNQDEITDNKIFTKILKTTDYDYYIFPDRRSIILKPAIRVIEHMVKLTGELPTDMYRWGAIFLAVKEYKGKSTLELETDIQNMAINDSLSDINELVSIYFPYKKQLKDFGVIIISRGYKEELLGSNEYMPENIKEYIFNNRKDSKYKLLFIEKVAALKKEA